MLSNERRWDITVWYCNQFYNNMDCLRCTVTEQAIGQQRQCQDSYVGIGTRIQERRLVRFVAEAVIEISLSPKVSSTAPEPSRPITNGYWCPGGVGWGGGNSRSINLTNHHLVPGFRIPGVLSPRRGA